MPKKQYNSQESAQQTSRQIVSKLSSNINNKYEYKNVGTVMKLKNAQN